MAHHPFYLGRRQRLVEQTGRAYVGRKVILQVRLFTTGQLF